MLDKFQKRARLGIGMVKLPGGSVKVLLAKPMTYMNISGEAVGAAGCVLQDRAR